MAFSGAKRCLAFGECLCKTPAHGQWNHHILVALPHRNAQIVNLRDDVLINSGEICLSLSHWAGKNNSHRKCECHEQANQGIKSAREFVHNHSRGVLQLR